VRARLWSILLGLWCVTAWGAEVIPAKPDRYFNDYAHVVSPGAAALLNQRLEDFERSSSSQILVAIFPKMQSDSSIEDYTVRVAESWRAGQKGKDNGAVLFLFIADHKMYLQVGYGLEGALPDARCKQIIDNEISPRLKAGDYDGALSAGVAAILAAAKGEYKGSGQTVADQRRGSPGGLAGWVTIIIIFVVFLSLLRALSRGNRGGGGGLGGIILGSAGYLGGGGGGSGGGGFSGGGFSGGGGSFGGGGAGGSW
jgi:uncharacterized protein